ncbi:hypothetical protein DPMN_044339 [Dreissena polymorpha]|uniref:Uncharacterized protein n=1 Tax=Dreissena polymorpha TaxID=45954 RepID=A0A9D4D320_DREPO|nr:hypothetical protein DPMN_044339 [Dreissena polymorpha]
MFYKILPLSNLLSSRLRDNNPNIADLSDKFRQTRIAELLTELFDNEWTDDLSALEQQYTEKQGLDMTNGKLTSKKTYSRLIEKLLTRPFSRNIHAADNT